MMNGYGLFSVVVGIGMIIALSGTVIVADAKDKSGVLKASELIGMKVQGSDGKNMGKIRDLVIGPDGDVRYAVLDFGGFLGIGDKYFAVPWDVLQRTKDGKKIALDMTKRDLKKAPGFDKEHWPDFSDWQQEVVIYEFYEVPRGVPMF
jgi:sporulation protein YlmC with PRC-barrel domain